MTKIGEPDHIGVIEEEPVFVPDPIREPDPKPAEVPDVPQKEPVSV